MTTDEMISALAGQDDKLGYDCLKLLMEQSLLAPAILIEYGEALAGMLAHKSGYTRIRAFSLLARNLRWEKSDAPSPFAEALLHCVFDEKPIVTRKHIEVLPELVRAQPALAPRVIELLTCADLSGYADSMRPLIEKDIAAAIKEIGSADK